MCLLKQVQHASEEAPKIRKSPGSNINELRRSFGNKSWDEGWFILWLLTTTKCVIQSRSPRLPAFSSALAESPITAKTVISFCEFFSKTCDIKFVFRYTKTRFEETREKIAPSQFATCRRYGVDIVYPLNLLLDRGFHLASSWFFAFDNGGFRGIKKTAASSLESTTKQPSISSCNQSC